MMFNPRIGVLLLCLVSILGLACNRERLKTMSDNDEGLDNHVRPRRGWSASGSLTAKNNAANLTNPSSVGFQAVFDEPDVYTVTIDVHQAIESTVPIRTVAYIEWSVAGNTVLRKISIAQTASISAAAEGVKVKVVDESLNLGGVNTVYSVVVVASRGVRTSIQRPSLIAPEGLWRLQGGTTKNFIMPKKAGVVAVSVQCARNTLFTPIPNQGIVISQNNGFANFARTDPRDLGQEWWTIQAGATRVEVSNQLVGEPFDCSVLWGIDG